MYKVMLCKKCGCFGLAPEDTIACPACNNEIFLPLLTREAFNKMSELEKDTYPFLIQDANQYDPDLWKKNKIRDARLLVCRFGMGEFGSKDPGFHLWGIF